MRKAPELFVVLLAAASSVSAEAGKRLPLAPMDDACLAELGYAEFRAALAGTVERRDGPRLQALFAQGGAMRVNGFGGHDLLEWDADRAEKAGVWRELAEILPLGCGKEGEQLRLPAMALLVDDPAVEPGYVAALSDQLVSARPGSSQSGLQLVRRGQLMEVVTYDQPEGWIRVLLNGRTAYIRSSAARSPHSFQLTLVREGGAWRIREFTGGI